jgi:Fe2+ or Zn2+ uptake regulation protein
MAERGPNDEASPSSRWELPVPGSSLEQLRRSGLRVTAVRVTALDVVATMPHLEVEALWREVGRRLGSVSKQAVYDALEVLAGAGLVRRIQPAGSPARYEARAGDNHHHVVCRSCGAAADVDCAVGAAPCLEPSDAHGYLVDEAEVVFWGICPACAERRAAGGEHGSGTRPGSATKSANGEQSNRSTQPAGSTRARGAAQ